uniref:Uncharacterized protein n=1 Tax=Plectus sambesii TaxID=2011161 RepID=A0A914XLC2_9BILA
MLGIDFPSLQQVFIVLMGTFIIKKLVKKLMQKDDKKVVIHKTDFKKDVVYLYQFHRSPVVPNLSPFCLKLETWLRINDIKHEVVPSWMMRSKEGLLPFVELNGEHIADSQLILFKLSKHFNKEDKLSKEKLAVARAVDRMIEGSLLFTLTCFKVVKNTAKSIHPSVSGVPLPEFVTNLVAPLIHEQIKGRLIANGMYKHDEADIIEIMRRDLQAISDILGSNKFVMGDEPSTVDCTVFGNLASCYYLPYDQPMKRLLQEEFTNVRDLLERIKSRFWSDWDSLIAKQ